VAGRLLPGEGDLDPRATVTPVVREVGMKLSGGLNLCCWDLIGLADPSTNY
jgi:hypothetical protein